MKLLKAFFMALGITIVVASLIAIAVAFQVYILNTFGLIGFGIFSLLLIFSIVFFSLLKE